MLGFRFTVNNVIGLCLWRNLCASQLYFVVRVRCRRKKVRVHYLILWWASCIAAQKLDWNMHTTRINYNAVILSVNLTMCVTELPAWQTLWAGAPTDWLITCPTGIDPSSVAACDCDGRITIIMTWQFDVDASVYW